MLGAKVPGRFGKPHDSEFMIVRGRKIHLSVATQYIQKLAQCRDAGIPVVFQDTKVKLNKTETDPDEVQKILEESIDVLIIWLESLRQRPHAE